jgi:hypothetical protein
MALWDAIKRLWLLGGIPEADCQQQMDKEMEELRHWLAQNAKAEASRARLARMRWQGRQQTPPDAQTAELLDDIREAERATGVIAGRAESEGKGPQQPA